MQRKITLLLLFITNFYAKSQELNLDKETGIYQFSEVVIVEGKNEEEIFNIVKEWASSNINNFNRRNGEKMDFLIAKKNTEVVDAAYKNNAPLKLSDKEAGKIIISVASKYNGTEAGTIRTMYVNYDLKIIVKDGKLKFEAINFSYNHINNANGKLMPISGFKDEGNCGSKGNFETLVNCKIAKNAFEKMIYWFSEDIKEIKESLIKSLKTSKNEKDF